MPEKHLTTVEILPQKSNVILDSYLSDIKLKRFETEKVTLFFLDDHVYKTVPWDSIRKYNLVLKRIEINNQEYLNLIQSQPKDAWGIPYP